MGSNEIIQAEFLCVHYPNPIPKSGLGNEHKTTFIYVAFFPHYCVEFIECKLPPTNLDRVICTAASEQIPKGICIDKISQLLFFLNIMGMISNNVILY